MDRYIRSSSFDMVHICIDLYSDEGIAGKAYNNTIDSYIEFNDVNELFMKIDHLFDVNGHPMASQIKRSFTNENKSLNRFNKPKILKDYKELIHNKGKVLTFDMVVKSRRNSSWQGIVFFNNEQYEFNDALEIIDIINKII